MFEFIGFLGGEAADPSPGEKVDCICPIGQMQDGCGIREGRYVESQGIDFVKLLASESLKTIPFYGFLPAFLFSHPNRFRIADLCDSFPPGEAKGGFAANRATNCNLRSLLLVSVPSLPHIFY